MSEISKQELDQTIREAKTKLQLVHQLLEIGQNSPVVDDAYDDAETRLYSTVAMAQAGIDEAICHLNGVG